MNMQIKGALSVILITLGWMAFAAWQGELKGILLFGCMIVGELMMWIVLAYTQRREHPKPPAHRGILTSLFLLIPSIAKALLPLIIGVGVVIGIAGWCAIAIWSKALSIQLKAAKQPIVIAMNSEISESNVGIVAAAINEQPTSEITFNELDSATHNYGGLIAITVPANGILEYSIDMQHWGELYIAGQQDELTLWEPIGDRGFFRLKSFDFQTDPRIQ